MTVVKPLSLQNIHGLGDQGHSDVQLTSQSRQWGQHFNYCPDRQVTVEIKVLYIITMKYICLIASTFKCYNSKHFNLWWPIPGFPWFFTLSSSTLCHDVSWFATSILSTTANYNLTKDTVTFQVQFTTFLSEKLNMNSLLCWSVKTLSRSITTSWV